MTTQGKPFTSSPMPVLITLKAGRPRFWCRCDRSSSQPFCDGRSHLGTGIEPLGFQTVPGEEEQLLCGCKQTSAPPYCDGTHANLPGGYAADSRTDAEREQIPWVWRDAMGVARLDGGCHVVRTGLAEARELKAFQTRCLVSRTTGSVHQSQFYCELEDSMSPPLGAVDSSLIFWFVGGGGTIDIAGRSFAVSTESGVHVRPGEQAVVCPIEGQPLKFFVSACPSVEDPVADAPPGAFDADWPDRVCRVDPEARRAAGPRYFQMLVDDRIGCTDAAQFIGHIPPSRAAMHRHLYEEALIIISGEGILWNEQSRARISAGDMVFLPRKHPHSVESLGPAGMDVVGVIHPGNNPGISY